MNIFNVQGKILLRRASLILTVLVLTSTSFAFDWTSPQIQSTSPKELLKAFIESPPYSGEMVFQYSSSFLQKNGNSATNEAGKAIDFYYRSYWRGSDYYLMRLASLGPTNAAAGTNVMEVGGMFQGKPWYYMLARGVLKISEDRLEDSKDVDLKNMHGLFESRFGSARSFGALHAQGSLKWTGDTFRATASASNKELTGKLSLDETSRPLMLHLSEAFKQHPAVEIIDFEYHKPVSGLNIPDSYSAVIELGTNKIPFCVTHYFHVGLSNDIPSENFNPRKIIESLATPRFNLVTSNSTVFYVTKDLKLNLEKPLVKETPRIIVIATLIAITTILVYLCWKLKKKTT